MIRSKDLMRWVIGLVVGFVLGIVFLVCIGFFDVPEISKPIRRIDNALCIYV